MKSQKATRPPLLDAMTIDDVIQKLQSLKDDGVSGNTKVEIPMNGMFLNQVRDIRMMFSKLEERNCLVIKAW